MATKKKATKLKRMISFSLINATDILERLERGETADVIDALQKLHTADLRWLVMNEQELLQATSSLLNKTASSESKLNDKVLGMFFPHSVDALNRVGVIK